jgi:hypothetical protein
MASGAVQSFQDARLPPAAFAIAWQRPVRGARCLEQMPAAAFLDENALRDRCRISGSCP